MARAARRTPHDHDADWSGHRRPRLPLPLAWPVDVWVTNLIAVPVIAFCWRARRARPPVAKPKPAGAGAMALVVIFAWLPSAPRTRSPSSSSHARLLADRLPQDGSVWAVANTAAAGNAAVAAAVILALDRAALCGCFIQFPDRRVISIDFQHAATGATRWPGRGRPIPAAAGWLDPHHAALYGSTVRARVSATRSTSSRIRPSRCAMGIAMPWRTASGAGRASVDTRTAPRPRPALCLDYLVIDRELDCRWPTNPIAVHLPPEVIIPELSPFVPHPRLRNGHG